MKRKTGEGKKKLQQWVVVLQNINVLNLEKIWYLEVDNKSTFFTLFMERYCGGSYKVSIINKVSRFWI